MESADRSQTGSERITQLLRAMLILIGLILVALPMLLDLLAGQKVTFGKLGYASMGLGVFYVILGCLLRRLPGFFLQISLLLIALPLFVCLIEITGRAVGFDFARNRVQWERTPIYYRQPTKPVGDAFFHRPGPQSWTGKVLTTELERIGVKEQDAYADEPTITVNYDADGFRNPSDLKDWQIVIIGDSFTELGYLPASDLFTTQLGSNLQCQVKNLGASYTGMFSYCCYLNEFGVSPKTTDAVIVFFEGNDWKDTLREYKSLMRFQETGKRETRDFRQHKQTSFIRAMAQLVSKLFAGTKQESAVNAFFKSAGRKTPLTLISAPPNQSDLSAENRSALQIALRRFADSAEQHGLRPWVVYLPCKRRALHGHLEFLEHCDPAIARWSLSDLPNWMKSQCTSRGIRFIDLTQGFREKAAEGILLYNHIYDTHLNRLGSNLVAKLIAEAFNRQNASQN